MVYFKKVLYSVNAITDTL